MTKSKKITKWLTSTESLKALVAGKNIRPQGGVPHRFAEGHLQAHVDGSWVRANVSIDAVIFSYCDLVEVA